MSKPDRAYVERLAELRLELAAALRPGVPTLALPYAVSRAEAESIARALGLGPQAAVTELERRGVLGCAAPLASLAALASRGGLAQGDRLALLAVGGGVEAAGIVWAT
jgi:3-oxoacyl-[acyl-carrier-protein] synthase III